MLRFVSFLVAWGVAKPMELVELMDRPLTFSRTKAAGLCLAMKSETHPQVWPVAPALEARQSWYFCRLPLAMLTLSHSKPAMQRKGVGTSTSWPVIMSSALAASNMALTTLAELRELTTCKSEAWARPKVPGHVALAKMLRISKVVLRLDGCIGKSPVAHKGVLLTAEQEADVEGNAQGFAEGTLNITERMDHHVCSGANGGHSEIARQAGLQGSQLIHLQVADHAGDACIQGQLIQT